MSKKCPEPRLRAQRDEEAAPGRAPHGCLSLRQPCPPSRPLPRSPASPRPASPPGALPPAAGPARPRFQHRGQRRERRRPGQRGWRRRAGRQPAGGFGPGEPPAGVPAPETGARLCESQPRAQGCSPAGAGSRRRAHLGALNFPEANACRS